MKLFTNLDSYVVWITSISIVSWASGALQNLYNRGASKAINTRTRVIIESAGNQIERTRHTKKSVSQNSTVNLNYLRQTRCHILTNSQVRLIIKLEMSLAISLREKGNGISRIIIRISAWACIAKLERILNDSFVLINGGSVSMVTFWSQIYTPFINCMWPSEQFLSLRKIITKRK